MRSLFIIVLSFTVASCCAIDQEAIEGFEAYEAARAETHRIFEAIESSKIIPSGESEELWDKVTNYDLPVEIRAAAKNKLEENQKLVDKLRIQYHELRAKEEKFEPLKEEYYRQRHIEYEKEQTRINIICSCRYTFII